MIHVFITDGHEIYLVVLVIYAFIANLSESQGSTALKFTWNPYDLNLHCVLARITMGNSPEIHQGTL